MDARIREFFQSEHIEYYAALNYRDLKETAPQILARETFVPRSVLLFLLPYYAGECENISRYAASLDYHRIIRQVGERLTSLLKELYPDAAFHTYGDHSPIDERHAALIAGLGIAGDNGLLINETYGSYVFIADVLTDLSPETLGATPPAEIRHCLHCGACRRMCPTGILRGEGSDCLSAITQRKGDLTENEIALMKRMNTVWGCDECQCHCPYNREPKLTPISFFYEERTPCLTSDLLAGMNKEDFQKRAYAWRGRKTVERNLKALGY